MPEGDVSIPEGVGRITTPLWLALWMVEQHIHPDLVFVILHGIQQGFQTGFGYGAIVAGGC